MPEETNDNPDNSEEPDSTRKEIAEMLNVDPTLKSTWDCTDEDLMERLDEDETSENQGFMMSELDTSTPRGQTQESYFSRATDLARRVYGLFRNNPGQAALAVLTGVTASIGAKELYRIIESELQEPTAIVAEVNLNDAEYNTNLSTELREMKDKLAELHTPEVYGGATPTDTNKEYPTNGDGDIEHKGICLDLTRPSGIGGAIGGGSIPVGVPKPENQGTIPLEEATMEDLLKTLRENARKDYNNKSNGKEGSGSNSSPGQGNDGGPGGGIGGGGIGNGYMGLGIGGGI